MFAAAEDWELYGKFAAVLVGILSGSVRASLVIDGSFPLSFVYLFVYALMSEFSITCFAIENLRMPFVN